MPMIDLTCKTLGDLAGGLFGNLVNDALATIKGDLDDRGNDAQVRTLKITIKFKREVGRDTESVTIDPEVKADLPSYRPITTISKVKVKEGEAVLLFQQDVPENPDQEAKIYEQGGDPPR